MSSQGVAFREPWVLEAACGVVDHADALHHATGADVPWHGEGDYLGEPQLAEGSFTNGARRLDGVPTTPSVAREHPRHFDARGERGIERRAQESGIPDDARTPITSRDHSPKPCSRKW